MKIYDYNISWGDAHLRVLINTPDISLLGGVANHYKGLRSYWTEDVYYNFVGTRKGIPGTFFLPFDLLFFFLRLSLCTYDVVLFNPSLSPNAMKRDSIFLKIASFFKVKKVVFFHGWDTAVAEAVDRNPTRFLRQYESADAFFVLANVFKRQLEGWGIEKPIFLTTTKFDDSMVENFCSIHKIFNNTVLFLARIEEQKGIFVALDAFNIIKIDFPDLTLKVVGDGGSLKKAKDYAKREEIQNVEFLGRLSGDSLVRAFMESDIYLLPTYSEGMPTTVLEAMAFGLPIVTRPVGGIVDFFEPDNMGALIQDIKPELFANALSSLLNDSTKLRKISAYNSEYAMKYFAASKVARDVEADLQEI